METRYLETLLATVETGSFSRALLSHRVEGFTHMRQRSLLVNRDQREAPIVLDFMKSVCRVEGQGSLCR